MSKTRDKPVTIVEAARLIYGTRRPTSEQIRRVYERMKSGVLPVDEYTSEPLEWTTTEQALADYLATEMLKRRRQPAPLGEARPAAAPAAHLSTSQAREARRLRAVYRGMWRDYFLAVMFRRRMAHRSLAFRRAVLAGQVALLVGLAGLFVSLMRFPVEPVSSERAAILRWIDENTERHQVTHWHPTRTEGDGQGLLVEVEYRYLNESRRMIRTRRTFRVVDEVASEVMED